MNNIYQHPEVEARSLWRQRALALNSETPYSNSAYLICDTSLHMCVLNSARQQLLERLRDNKREIKRWVQHMCEQINC